MSSDYWLLCVLNYKSWFQPVPLPVDVSVPPASNGQQTQPSSDITDEEIQKFLDE